MPAAQSGRAFPTTRLSIIGSLASEDLVIRDRAFATLAHIYWRPVYKYIRLRWNMSREDAEDLTQEFFAQANEKRFLDHYDPTRARFRTFLRTCVDGSVANTHKATRRLKRGGGYCLIPMDFVTAEAELQSTHRRPDDDLEEFFRVEWMRSVFSESLDRLRAECDRSGAELQFALFHQYDVVGSIEADRPTYAALGQTYGIPATQVTNYLAATRRRLRRHVLDVLREMTASDREYAEAARDLLGVRIQ